MTESSNARQRWRGRLVPGLWWAAAGAATAWRVAALAADQRADSVGESVGTLVLLLVFGLLVARALPFTGRWVAPAVLSLLAAARPLWEAWDGGVPGPLPVVAVLAGWLWGGRRGGVLIGLGAVCQPALLLFGALLWLTGRRGAARAAGAAFLVGGALSLAAGAGAPWAFDPDDLAAEALANQSLHGALLRLGAHGPAEVALLLPLAGAVCVLALRRAARFARDDQPLLAAAVLGCAGLAVTPAPWAFGQLWLVAALAGRVGRRTADRPVWPVLLVLALVLDGGALVPKLAWLAPVGENVPLLAALAAACLVRFLPRTSPRWERPVRAGEAGRPNLLLELLLIRVGYFCYSWVRSQARGDRAAAEAHGHQILGLERALRADVEHGLNHAVAGVGWLADAMDFAYATFHFAVPLTILGWLLVRHPAAYRAGRRALAFTTLLGLVGFWLYPLAPPRLMPGLGYLDTANGVQDLDDPRYGHLTGITNPYAAMPSLHVGWSLWCAVMLWRHAPYRWLRVAGFAYPLLTTVVIMATANHYLLDAVGGVLVVAGGLAASGLGGRVVRRRHALQVGAEPAVVGGAPAAPAGPDRPWHAGREPAPGEPTGESRDPAPHPAADRSRDPDRDGAKFVP
ncbi:phosphatase PAP2 family protein [Streptomyces millisiae]|uniref:Phosphatase PAP2 family protein n=1 Tax=Streptomyces millisiae TaxID=3075542 RepID=A0ABU2LUA4_9ACTN|nr:phosphatase PAP2 family protein [Streptomyces sp. DSM 44918]MDT0321136.1 phosphatase PAP2 family protein [Streptomyces sp. DSM 44918]